MCFVTVYLWKVHIATKTCENYGLAKGVGYEIIGLNVKILE